MLTLSALTEGPHTMEVRSIDASKNIDPTPAIYTWTVDTVAPETTITDQPAPLSNDSTPTFNFAASEAGVIFTYAVDGGSFVPGKSGLAARSAGRWQPYVRGAGDRCGGQRRSHCQL